MQYPLLFAASLMLAIPIADAAEPDASQTVTLRVRSYVVDGPNPLPVAATDQALTPYLGEQPGIGGLQAAAKALEAAFQTAGYGLYTVVLPPQDVGEVVHLTVIPRPIAQVKVTDSAEVVAVRRALPTLQEGQTPNLKDLTRSMALANENPARQVSVRFAESATAGGLDANVDVQSRSPWSGSIKLDNTGTDQPGRSRLSTSLTHANLFGLDHAATISYTASPEDWQAIKQYGVFYKLPSYATAGSWSFYGFRSSSNTGTVGNFFTVSGSGKFAGLSYTQHLLDWGNWRPTLQVGIDDKYFGDASAFNGSPIGHDIRSRPLTLTLAARNDGLQLRAGGSIAYATNLHGGGENDAVTYRTVRAGASRDWEVWRANGDASWQFAGGYTLAGRLALQAARQPLISGEQFGIGGQDSVRALETRQVMGDSGYQASVELWLPPLKEGLGLLGFVDTGWVQRNQPASGTARVDGALAIGFGARWQVNKVCSVSLDYARLLDGVSGMPAGRERGYLTLNFQL